jgi:HEAT repeat protein
MDNFNPEKLTDFESATPPLQHEGGVVLTALQAVRVLTAQKDCQALAALLVASSSVSTRRVAAKALADIATTAQASLLAQVLGSDSDRAVRLNMVRALGRLGVDEFLPALLLALKDKEAPVRVEAAHAISRYNSATAFELLLAALNQKDSAPDRFIRQYAAEALGNLGDRRAVPALIASLKDASDLVRAAVAVALGRLGERSAIDPLQRVRHKAAHGRGFDCAECKAIDRAIAELSYTAKDTL